MRSDDEMAVLRDRCERFVQGHGRPSAASLLADIPVDTAMDRYGAGGVVAELEAEVAGLLGKPAAAFLPSGTMAQQVTLRVLADRLGRRTVVFHPTCHLHLHEDEAAVRLHQIVTRPVGAAEKPLTRAELDRVAEAPAVLLLELPQREIGGQQPAWTDVLAQVGWARERGAWAHLDGARLWESAAGYGVPPAEVAAPFDTVYVSFYKGIGALAGCCLAGPEDVVAEVREWRHRMGGTLFGMWPAAASGLTCLRRRLPLMPGYLTQARAIADELQGVAGVTVLPDPPQTPMMHLLLGVGAAVFQDAVVGLAEERSTWTWAAAAPTPDPHVVRVELSVGDATMGWEPAELADVIARLAAG